METRANLRNRSQTLRRGIAVGLVGLMLWTTFLELPAEDAPPGLDTTDTRVGGPLVDARTVHFPSIRSAAKSWENPIPLPADSRGHAMAYDAESDRILLVGVPPPFAVWLYPSVAAWTYDLNLNNWMDVTRPVGLSPSAEGALAYDSESDRLVFVVECESGSTPRRTDTWAYHLNWAAWTNMSPSSRPSDRWGYSMAYAAYPDRVILFGGFSCIDGLPLDDTWAYDYDSNTWTNEAPSSPPSGRRGHAMAYDSESDRIILFGGEYPDYDDTWAYEPTTNTWTNMTPAQGPPARFGHAMAYDSESDRVILFGGAYWRSDIGNLQFLNDTWAYDFNSNKWTNVSTAGGPGPQYEPAMAYDSESDRIVLYGEDDTWSYDFNSNTWTGERVVPSRHSSMVYDSALDRIILFDGSTWSHDSNSNAWTDLRPSPSPLQGELAYDSESDRVILFAGGGYVASETWAYDYNLNTWTNMSPAYSPPWLSSEVVYDAGSDRVVLLGRNVQTGLGGETWAYDFNSNAWTNLTGPIGPSHWFGHALAYDSQSDRIILFGGAQDFSRAPVGMSGETWSYDLDSNAWTNMTTSSGPGPRAYHDMTYDEDLDMVILYGGYRPPEGCCDAYDDTWAYDFETNTWTNMNPTTNPGPRVGQQMTYDSESQLVVLFGGSPGSIGPWSFRSPEAVPSAPRSLHAAEGSRQVTLAWDSPASDGDRPLTGYRIYRFTWPEGLSIVATVGLIHTYRDTNLTNGALYYYWVSALNGMGEGPISGVVAATPKLMVSAPAGLRAIAGNSQVVLTWQAASSADGSLITGYRLYRGTSVSSVFPIANLGDVLTYVDSNATNGVQYHYRVSAMSGQDEGPRSIEAVVTPRESAMPTIAIQSPADGTTLTTTSVVVSGMGSDDTAILRVELSRDGTNWVTAIGTTSWSGSLNLGEGANTIYARATDTSGNTETVSITVTVLNPVVAALASPIVIAAIAAGVAIVMSAFLMRKWRDRRWERK